MADNLANDYGWTSTEAEKLGHLDYITPSLLEFLKRSNAKRVLDLGSGNGVLCAKLKAAGYDIAGMEYDEAGVQVAKKNHPAINFYRFGVQDDPALLLKTEPLFDTVISTEVVEHLFSPHQLPLFASAVLKDKGTLILTTPYHGYLKNLALSLVNGWDHHHDPLWHGGHIKFWSRKTLTLLLEKNGFRVVDFAGVGRLPWLWKSMVLVAQKV